MAKPKRKSKASWYASRKKQLIFGGIFAVLFAVLGIVYLNISKAATVKNPYTCAANAYGIPTTTLKSGSTGNCVKHFQWYANRENYGNDSCNNSGVCGISTPYGFLKMPLKEDGIFGSQTVIAAKYIQKRCGIAIDGVVGVQTWYKTIAWYLNNNKPCSSL